eukprot:2913714-Rhodomonas_salina.1
MAAETEGQPLGWRNSTTPPLSRCSRPNVARNSTARSSPSTAACAGTPRSQSNASQSRTKAELKECRSDTWGGAALRSPEPPATRTIWERKIRVNSAHGIDGAAEKGPPSLEADRARSAKWGVCDAFTHGISKIACMGRGLDEYRPSPTAANSIASTRGRRLSQHAMLAPNSVVVSALHMSTEQRWPRPPSELCQYIRCPIRKKLTDLHEETSTLFRFLTLQKPCKLIAAQLSLALNTASRARGTVGALPAPLRRNPAQAQSSLPGRLQHPSPAAF